MQVEQVTMDDLVLEECNDQSSAVAQSPDMYGEPQEIDIVDREIQEAFVQAEKDPKSVYPFVHRSNIAVYLFYKPLTWVVIDIGSPLWFHLMGLCASEKRRGLNFWSRMY